PTWMREGFGLLWECEGGREWNEAVVKWVDLERAYGLVNSTTPLPKPGRPDAIGAWVKGGRSTSKMPPIKLPKHAKDWWKWWASLAPSWRQRDDAGRPIIGGHGPWGGLVKPGGNGMLTALLCLGWWRRTEGKATEDWLAAVEDVKWVLAGLVSEAK
ncbi:hypothetical protein B0H13DRAFT_1613087, partial [Mycena leptocephala]